MKKRFTKEDLLITQQETLYQGYMRLCKITFDHALYQGGLHQAVQREILERGKAVGVLLYDPELQEFVMVEQVRVGAIKDEQSPWLLEIVAGMVEPNESEQEVAHREAAEEAGAAIKTLLPIQDYWVSPGGSDERVSLFLGIVDAQSVRDYAGLDEEHEDIKVLRIVRDDALKMLQAGHINNAMALIALQWFFLNEQSLDIG